MSNSQSSMDDFADELVDKLTGKLVEQSLSLGLPLQGSSDELEDDDILADSNDQEESMLDQVLSLRGGMAAMKAMKAMKAMQAMKAMKKKAMKKKAMKKLKAFTQKRYAFAGKISKTASGLTKADLVKNKAGKVVSKKKQALGKKNKWIDAVQKARKALGSKGFLAIKKGSPLYTKAKSLYR